MISASARPVTPSPMRRLASPHVLLRQGEARDLDTLSSMRTAMRTASNSSRSRRVRAERSPHQRRQVDRAEKAGAVGRQRLLAAGIGRLDGLAVYRLFTLLMRSMKITPGSAAA